MSNYPSARLENNYHRFCADHPELLCVKCGEHKELDKDGWCLVCLGEDEEVYGS